MNESELALGILETQGLTAILEATDVMLKAANVKLVGKEKIGAAYVTVMVRGDVAAVQAAISAGASAVGALGKEPLLHLIGDGFRGTDHREAGKSAKTLGQLSHRQSFPAGELDRTLPAALAGIALRNFFRQRRVGIEA